MRFVPLDRLRALAVLSMVQGHTFNVLLADAALPAELMRVHALLHGLTAPAFLFGAGLAFGVATYPHYEERRSDRSILWRRLRRYAALWLLGYALQLPGGSLMAALRLKGTALLPVLHVGPLQLIAVCLSVAELSRILRSPRNHACFAALLGIGIAIGAPTLWALTLDGPLELMLGPWLSGRSGSLFPIFPWASFAFFGVACAYPLVRSSSPRLASGAVGPGARAFCVIGVSLAVASYSLFALGVRLAEPAYFWHTSPLYLMFRLGLVVLLLGLLHSRAKVVSSGATCRDGERAQPYSMSSLLARHSLTAYVTHLLVLYGTPLTPSLHRHVGRTLSAPEASLVFALLLVLTLLLIHALAWLRNKREYGWLRVALTALVLATVVR